MKSKQYTVKAKVWLYPGTAAAWHFVTIPKAQSAEIKSRFGAHKRGWNSLPVAVAIGKTRWETSVFWDRRAGGYLLPLKAAVRKKEDIIAGDTPTIRVEIRLKICSRGHAYEGKGPCGGCWPGRLRKQ